MSEIYIFFSADAARRKFKSLRDQFRAELKKVPQGKSGDPGLPMEDYLTTWQYFKMLFFLRDYILGRKTVGNLTSTAARINDHALSLMNEDCSHTEEFSSETLSLLREQNIQIIDPLSPTDIYVPVSSVSSHTDEINSISYSLHDNAQSTSCGSGSQTANPRVRSRSQTPTASVSKKAKIKTPQEELIDLEKEKVAIVKQISANDDDADRYYLLSLLPQLKILPPKKLNETKISKILHEAIYEETN